MTGTLYGIDLTLPDGRPFGTLDRRFNYINMDELEWTGERLVTSVHTETMVEHLQRYYFAQMYCNDKVVLDIASGEGYGSSILARVSKLVIGVDIDSLSVDHASSKYGNKTLKFITGSATKIPLENHSVDVVVSFETLEHFEEHQVFINEVLRVLKPEGMFIISSPDKHYYTEVTGFHNHHHVNELYEHEFVELLSSNFSNVTTFHQRFVYGCLLVPKFTQTPIMRNMVSYESCESHVLNPEYVLCLATNNSDFIVENLGVFSDFSRALSDYKSNSNLYLGIQSSRLFRIFLGVKSMLKPVIRWITNAR